MPLPLVIDDVATVLAGELALLSARATMAGLNLTAYLIDMAHDEVMRESVKIALPHGQEPIILPGSVG